MLREIAISSYLFIFRTIFVLFKLFPQQDKITFVASFGDNINHVVESAARLTNKKRIILKKNSCCVDFARMNGQKTIQFETLNMIDLFKSIYHLATSKVIFIDNYFGFLSVTNFKSNVQCIQLWHAAGAIKQFGLMDPSVEHRSARANARFKKVYQRFSYVTVGSEKMSAIFQKSFGLSNDKILRTGVPRTDFFFNKIEIARISARAHQELPIIQNKKVILYAPTFREKEMLEQKIKLDLELMYQQLSDDHILLLRLHPAVNGSFLNNYPDFIVDVAKYQNINHLLVVTDLLITDYSSIPFEYALLEKPILYFTYDLKAYTKERGFWEDYLEQLPGPMVTNTTELIKKIKEDPFDIEKIRAFSKEWNQYSHGNSSENIVSFLTSQES